jgi:hypothetical protein
MPVDYKYQFISKGRMAALERACTEARELQRQFKSSGTVSSSVIERIELLRALLARAACHPLNYEEVQMLESIFGRDMGEERND